MEDVIRMFGVNAGKVWEALNASGPLTKHQIIHQTHLKPHELQAAVGWLARENKIRKDGEFYSLSETNLTGKIGSDAGTLLSILKTLKQDISQISLLSKMDENDVHAALGWLAREGKLNEIFQDFPSFQQDSIKEKIDQLQQEIQFLHEDIVSRNRIIQELTTQLSEKQTQFIKRTDAIERLHGILGRNQSKMKMTSERLEEANKKIFELSDEIHQLHNDIVSRNRIIQELTTQLSEKQTQFIERTTAIEQLQHSLKQMKSLTTSPVTPLQQRIHQIADLQEVFEKNHPIDVIESTLFNNEPPALKLQKTMTSPEIETSGESSDVNEGHPVQKDFHEVHHLDDMKEETSLHMKKSGYEEETE